MALVVPGITDVHAQKFKTVDFVPPDLYQVSVFSEVETFFKTIYFRFLLEMIIANDELFSCATADLSVWFYSTCCVASLRAGPVRLYFV